MLRLSPVRRDFDSWKFFRRVPTDTRGGLIIPQKPISVNHESYKEDPKTGVRHPRARTLFTGKLCQFCDPLYVKT